MREALHIFAKDSRHLWLPILIMLGALVFFVNASLAVLPVYDLSLRDTLGVGGTFLALRYSPLIFGIGWCYLVVHVVHADALHGDRQFWLTRPYRRSALFASKVLFVLVYVSAPLTAAQVAIIVLSGSSPAAVLPGLFWSQLLVLGLLIGPLFALAAMSVSMSWFVAALVPLAVVLTVLLSDTARLAAFDWVRLSFLGLLTQLVVAAVLWIQYRHRRTRLAWAILAVGVVAAVGISRGVGWETAFGVQQRLHGASAASLSASLEQPLADESSRRARARGVVGTPLGAVRIPLWFTVDGAGRGALMACEGSRVTLTAEGGLRQRDAVRPNSDGRLVAVADGCPGVVELPRSAEAFLTAPVTVDADLYVTVFDNPITTDVPMAATRTVPHVGNCVAETRTVPAARGDTWQVVEMVCDSAFRSPRVAVSFRSADMFWPMSRPTYSLWPADLRLQPIERLGPTFRSEDASLSVETRSVLAHERLHVTAEGVDLNAYRANLAR